MIHITPALLSIITPTYNCGNYIHRLLDSILSQTYPYIEMYVVDDGSTDNTKDIISSYTEKFKQRGYELYYIYQENSGQSTAINKALKLIKGEYLTWPDADDWYKTTEVLELLISKLQNSSEDVGMVRCQTEIIDENNFATIGYMKPIDNKLKMTFDECFYERNGFWVCPGGYIVRSSALDITIPHREIYTERAAGQNLQLFYPILYSYDCITINEPLYCVLNRHTSHSRKRRSLSNQAERLRVYARTRLFTLDRIVQMPNTEKGLYKRATFLMYRNDLLHMYITDDNLPKVKEIINILKNNNIPIPFKYIIMYQFKRIYKKIKRSIQ